MSLAAEAAKEQPLPNTLKAALTELLGDRFTTATSVREHHGKGEAYHTAALPDGVAYANSTEEAAAVVKACAGHGIPIIPYGTGTALEGHTLALRGGITLDLSGMDQVIRVSPEDMDCTVQAGVNRNQLNEYLRDTGLFFPVDPGADASLGGMAATRASGTTTVRYGAMRENVLAMKALWTQEEAAFHGDFVNFDDCWAYPKPAQDPHPPIILGGETDYTLRRIVEYGDGWLPRARHGFDAAENMARLARMAEAGGRDASEFSVSVFGAPDDKAMLDGWAEAGVTRALLTLPSEPRDDALRRLDRYAAVLS